MNEYYVNDAEGVDQPEAPGEYYTEVELEQYPLSQPQDHLNLYTMTAKELDIVLTAIQARSRLWTLDTTYRATDEEGVPYLVLRWRKVSWRFTNNGS